MSCTYTFNNKKYSYQGLIRTIENSKIDIIPLVSDNALNYLKRNLNMSENEIIIVAGLIQGKSLGRFREDGKILLSSLADDSVAYHEAFHRVFRGYLSEKDRSNVLNEFKKRKNWKSLIEPYKSSYKGLTEDELVEEFLADEFSDYVTNNGDIKIEPVIKTLFERLIDFIKKVLGLKTKHINDLYEKINTGFFNNYTLKQDSYKGANQILINNNVYSADIKNEFVQGVARLVIQQILNDNSLYDFIKHSETADIDAYYRNAVALVVEAIYESNEQLAEDLLEEYNNPSSYINNQFKQYIETLIGKFDFNIIEAGEQLNTDESGEVNKEEGRQHDDVAWKASFEIDPKTSMSKAIKLLLASFENNDKGNALGIASQVRWSQAFNKIARHLAGIPTQDSIQHLSKLNEPWVDELIERIGGLNPDSSIDSDIFRLRNDFIKTFAKTEHNFAITKITDKGITWFDANQETAQKRVVKSWKNNLISAIKEADTFENWVNQLKEVLENKRADDMDYQNLLGIVVDDELKNQILYTINNENYYYISAMNSISKYIIKSIEKNKFNNDKLPDYNKIFDKNNFDVEGLIEHVANAQLEYEDAVDLMLFSRDKKLYGISLNTHTTTTINTLNYIASIIDPNDSLENKLELIDHYLPGILNYKTIDKLDDGTYQVRSKWLNHILQGNKVKVVIMDGIVTDTGENEATADINETDLYAMTLNMSLHGVNISIKHSDRSTFYGYKMEKANIFDYQEANTPNKEAVVDYLVKVLQSELNNEVKRANLQDIPLFQYFEKVYKNSQIFNLKNISNVNAYDKTNEKLIRDLVNTELDKYTSELNRFKVLNDNLGVDGNLLEYHNGDLDLMIASSFANQMLTHLEEVKIFLSDFAFFKNADDFYKRMSTTSGTGDVFSKDEVTNAKIAELNAEPFKIINPKTGETTTLTYNKDSSGIVSSLTIYEKKDYISDLQHVKSKVSPLDGSQISELEYNFEWNLIQDELSFAGVTTLEELSKDKLQNIKKLSQAYAAAYDEINENDGQSWINMFFFREYMIRLGSWSTAMDNLFNVELQILNAKDKEDLKNINIEIDGKTVNVFDIDLWKDGIFESAHTLKPQYAGFTQSYLDYKKQAEEGNKNYDSKISAYTIYKTSYHALWPSTVLGTNLQQMHHFMLKNKVDAIHMNSANKSGAIDVQSVFKQYEADLNPEQQLVVSSGYNFYDSNGVFNDEVFEGELGNQLLEQSMSIGDFMSMKDQVRIGNKEKEKIKGSTQSLKILISNLMPNGQPRFPGAELLANRYSQIINRLVQNNIDDLVKEVGYDGTAITKLNVLVDLIKTAAQDRNSAINIIEAIDAFLYDPYIETLPNKTKLENIFYSIINNNVVDFNRPGNSIPQLASTGFEPFGSRNAFNDGKKVQVKTNDDLVKFYSFEYDEAGNITKVNPAEIIMPFPKAWIDSVSTASGLTNINDIVNWVNERIENGELDSEITFKGLRIPNQQLSSNDVVKVKKFNLPSNNAYVIVPSELVAKTGGDFDIDKFNMYWSDSKSLFKNKAVKSKNVEEYTNAELQNALLQLEKEILLHPRNAHMLLMPIVDDLLKNDLFKEIVLDLKKETKDNTTFFQSLTPTKNVEKSIDFVKSKFGVGIVALDITGHAVFMNDNVNLNQFYLDDEGNQISTRLLFEGLGDNYSLTAMTDNSGRIISDVQSQVMNSQVDAGKDPYAVKLGINNQTLNMVLYLNRRGVDVRTALKFVNQPIIQEYTFEQRFNESVLNKVRGDEIAKGKLVDNIAYNYDAYGKIPNNFVITNKMLDEGLLKKDVKNQFNMLQYFLRIVDEVSAFNDIKNSLTVDTKGKKDKSSVEAFRTLQEKIDNTQLLSKEDLFKLRNEGILAPFHRAQDLYEKFYNPFYAIDSSDFGQPLKAFKEALAKRQAGTYKKEKVRTTIENDFFMFLIQNFNNDFSVEDFNSLFGLNEEKSLPEEIRELQSKTDNIVIKAMFPLISISKEDSTNKMHDVLRLFERELTSIDLNDFIDAMKDIKDLIDEDLYKKIIRMSLYQAGFINSPFSLTKIFPTFDTSSYENNELKEFTNEYLRDIQIEALSLLKNMPNTDMLFTQFVDLFFRNNPEFLPKKWYSKSQFKYYYPYSRVEGKRVLMYKENKDSNSIKIPQLGSSYFKRYFISQLDFTSGIESTKKENNNNQTQLKIISGGQFGGDFGALLAGKELGLETGGTAPKGYKVDYTDKRAVGGSNKELINFNLKESTSSNYPERTMQNVDDSDGTIAFMWGDSVGTSKTIGYAQTGRWINKIDNFNKSAKKPYLIITTKNEEEAASQIKNFIEKNNIRTLNVAGHRETSQPGIEIFVKNSLVKGLKNINIKEQPKQLSLFEDSGFPTEIPNTIRTSGGEPITITTKDSINKDFNPDITAELKNSNEDGEMKFVIRDGGKWIGRVYANSDGIYLTVTDTEITGKSNSGTSAYLQLADYATKNDLILKSSNINNMNEANIRTWERFVNVGLAAKLSTHYEFNSQKNTNEDNVIGTILKTIKEDVLNEFGLDTVNTIVNDDVYYSFLINKLQKINPNLIYQYYNNRYAYTYDTLNPETNIKFDIADMIYKSNGLYSSYGNKVKLTDSATKKTIIHEGIHALLDSELDKKGEFYDNIMKLYETADKYNLDNNLDYQYGYSDVYEFLAEALSNPEFMQELNSIPYKKETILTQLLNLLNSFLAKMLGIELNTGSVLAEVVSLSEKVLQNKESAVNDELNKIDSNHNMTENIVNFFPDKRYMNETQLNALTDVFTKLPEDVNLSCSI